MGRLRSLLGQSPAIAIASAALALSVAGGATAATVGNDFAAAPVTWHQLTLVNGWKYGGFSSFHAAYYLDANHVVHLRGSAHLGINGKAVFVLPRALRPSPTCLSERSFAPGHDGLRGRAPPARLVHALR